MEGELNKKFQQLTGLNFIDIEKIIADASDDEAQQKAYDFIHWNIKQGRILEMDKFAELADAIEEAISGLNKKSTVEDVTEEDEGKYTAAEAAAYNATLTGAVKAGDEKTPAQSEVLYTAETAAAYNATLDGAVSEGDVETPAIEEVLYTAEDEEVIAGTKQVGDVKIEGQEAVLYTAETAAAHNATLDGAVSEGDIEIAAIPATTYTQEEADAYNATLTGAVKAGDPKPAQTNG